MTSAQSIILLFLALSVLAGGDAPPAVSDTLDALPSWYDEGLVRTFEWGCVEINGLDRPDLIPHPATCEIVDARILAWLEEQIAEEHEDVFRRVLVWVHHLRDGKEFWSLLDLYSESKDDDWSHCPHQHSRKLGLYSSPPSNEDVYAYALCWELCYSDSAIFTVQPPRIVAGAVRIATWTEVIGEKPARQLRPLESSPADGGPTP